MVDCELLKRPSRQAYDYEITPAGFRFFQDLVEAPDVESFLVTSLASSLTGQERLEADENLIGRIAEAYSPLRSGLGYVSIRELAVLTVCRELEAGRRTEIADIEQAIREAPQIYGRQVRLAHSRTAGIGQVRFDTALVQSLRQ